MRVIIKERNPMTEKDAFFIRGLQVILAREGINHWPKGANEFIGDWRDYDSKTVANVINRTTFPDLEFTDKSMILKHRSHLIRRIARKARLAESAEPTESVEASHPTTNYEWTGG